MGESSFRIDMQGLDELKNMFENFANEVEKELYNELAEFGMFAEEATKNLVHHDQGDLMDSISFDQPVREGGSLVIYGGSNLSYALRRHEEPYGSGIFDKFERGRKYPKYYVGGLGAGTRAKPNWRGYVPGRKYLDNAVKAIKPDFDDMLANVLDKVIGE